MHEHMEETQMTEQPEPKAEIRMQVAKVTMHKEKEESREKAKVKNAQTQDRAVEREQGVGEI